MLVRKWRGRKTKHHSNFIILFVVWSPYIVGMTVHQLNCAVLFLFFFFFSSTTLYEFWLAQLFLSIVSSPARCSPFIIIKLLYNHQIAEMIIRYCYFGSFYSVEFRYQFTFHAPDGIFSVTDDVWRYFAVTNGSYFL